jgi:NAD(P)H-nitrite reductase large subunit
MMKIVIIGNGPAAVRALQTIATHKALSKTEEFEVIVISQERAHAYSPMLLVGYFTGELLEKEILLRESHPLSHKKLLGEKVIKVQDTKNKITLESGKEISYDRLLIASGASPLIPFIKGMNKEGIYFFNRLKDVRKLSRQYPNSQDIIIIGAGAIGIELAIALKKLGKNVLIMELLDQILPQILDKDLAEYFERELSFSGIKFLLGEPVIEVTGDDRAIGIIVGNKKIDGDLILVTTGVKPNVDFLKFSNVKVNTGILVNETMQTSVPNIYAAGDVAESLDPYGGHELVFNWYNAIDQAMIAGYNLIGIEKPYKPSPALAVIKGADPPVISVGRKYGEEGYETLSYTDKQRSLYEKIFIRNNRIDCYQAIGISDKVSLIYNYIKGRKDVRSIKGLLGGKDGPACFWC